MLIVDVQGYEFEVLKGINWNYPPRYLMLEDDQSKSDKLISFLNIDISGWRKLIQEAKISAD